MTFLIKEELRRKIMPQFDLKERTIDFSVRLMDFIESLPDTRENRIISNQVLRSSSSVGANYRAARRAKSPRDFINKLKIVEEEIDETIYWLEILKRRKCGKNEELVYVSGEASELLSIFVSSIKTAREKLKSEGKSKI
jgi:four helix bundle protein